MRQVGSREFQLNYQKVTEPLLVTGRQGKVIGRWYPDGTEPNAVKESSAGAVLKPAGPSFNSRPFTPVPKSRPKK